MVELLLALAMLLFAGPVDDAVTTERLERMLAEEDHQLIVQTFRRHPGKVLPYVDGYLEGGLKMIEDGKPVADARASFRRGLAFAELASEAFDDPIFVDYAASFGSWSPQEQANFRKGQEEYGLGRRAAADADAARAHFERSLQLATRLNDSWGMAMASAGMARVSLATGERDAALRHGDRAVELYRHLRLTGSEADALVEYARAQPETATTRALQLLRRAWQLVEHDPANEKRYQRVLDAYTTALDRTGQRDAATEVRRAAAKTTKQRDEPDQ